MSESLQMCPGTTSVNEHLLRETPKFNMFIERSVPWEAPYENMLNTKTWTETSPIMQRVVYEEEIIPDDPKMWALWEGEKCEASCAWDHYDLKDSERVQKGFLYKTALETQSICLESMKHRHEAGRVASNRLQNLSRNSLRMRDLFAKYGFRASVPNLIPNPGERGGYVELEMQNIEQTVLASPCGAPGSTVTPGMLKHLRTRKTYTDSMPIGDFSGAPLYPMLMGDEMYDALVHIDSSFADIIKEHDPARLLLPVGGSNSERVGNWIPRLIQFPDRAKWNDQTGCLEIVPAHINVDGPQGGSRERVNPEWEDAPYEAIDFIDRQAVDILRMPESGSIGAYHFDSQSYDGVPRYYLKTIRKEYDELGNLSDVCQVPYGNEGSFYSLLVRGIMPNKTDTAFRLWVQRAGIDQFQDGQFKPVNGTCKTPDSYDVMNPKTTQGELDTELFIVTHEALPTAWVGQELTVAFEDRYETAVLTSTHAVEDYPNRYKFTFAEAITPGCYGGARKIVGPAPTQTIDPATDDFDCPTTATPLTCSAISPVPAGYVSALKVQAAVDAATPAVNDQALVDFGTQTVTAVVLANDGVNVDLGFATHEVTCSSGEGVLSVNYVPAATPVLACYALNLTAGLDITAFTDGDKTLSANIPVDTSYATVADALNTSLGSALFEPTATGVQYCGTGTAGDFTMSDASTISAAAC